MKKSNKNSIVAVVAMLVVSFAFVAFGLTVPLAAFALVPAIAPDLGTAASFSVFGGSAMSADALGATVSGDLGVNPGLSASGPWTVGGTSYFGTGGLSGTAKTDATTAYTSMDLTNQSGGTTWDPTDNATRTPAPGLYKVAGSATINGAVAPLTLTGTASDVWIFQIADSLTFAANTTVNLGGSASACNVYWYIASDATINGAPGNKFVGTLIANGNVSLVTGATVIGRMMALTGTLSTAGVTNISGCAVAAPAVGSGYHGTINVVKVVINDNGGTKTVADFPLAVNDMFVASGVTNTFGASLRTTFQYKVTESNDLYTETNDLNYTRVFSGDCDAGGVVYLNPNDNKICIITNDDIGAPVIPPVPPLIDVVKVASPLTLPDGPGAVAYTYTLRNIGTVPMTNITMVGDTCSPIVLASGDTNTDAKLDVSETWVYHCSTTLSETHTNTVTATGWANGISAVDIASATVVVGAPVVPPLIHLVKKPSVFTLAAPGGAVTYTYTVTNPGTEPLGNVSIADDKCTGLPGRVSGHPGDINKNDLLESNETWSFTCQSNLTQTTTNTGTASGEANGLVARDFAIATVVVAATVPELPKTVVTVPKLPDTGVAPMESVLTWPIVSASIFAVLFLFYIVRKKQTV